MNFRILLLVSMTLAAVLAWDDGAVPQPIGPDPGTPAAPGAPAVGVDPILTVGHGVMFGRDGKALTPTLEFLEEAQRYHLSRLEARVSEAVLARYRALQERLSPYEDTAGIDSYLLRSFRIDWLADRVGREDRAGIRAKNWAMRTEYLRRAALEGRLTLPENYWNVPDELLDLAADEGMIRDRQAVAGGEEYIVQCREADVPIPPTWNGGGWTHNGQLSVDFLTPGGQTDVYTAISDAPDGVCFALPRGNDETIGALGVICLGRDTSTACFWDRGTTDRDAVVPLDEFVGGADLLGGNGVCSDCHAGENPFVIHPGTELDLGISLKPQAWHVPLVHPSWPQNPGPTALLDYLAVVPPKCTGCHNAGVAGAFPEVGLLPSYCAAVLKPAAIPGLDPDNPTAGAQTMPTADPGDPVYAVEAIALSAFCNQGPPGGSEVPGGDFPEDPDHVSHPIAIGPLYSCVKSIEVRGAVLDAEIRVFIDGVHVASETARQPSQQAVSVPQLEAGQEVYAVQVIGGVQSEPSDTVTVLDHNVAFPDGLPAPEIDPDLVYQCGRVVAVRHARGADITVFSNGGSPVTSGSTTDWTNVQPAVSPFAIGDSFIARYQFCQDQSPISDPVSAVAAPPTTPDPTIDPMPTIPGQELIDLYDLLNGALTSVEVPPEGVVAEFSTAVGWNHEVDIATPLGHPLQGGDDLIARSMLCEPGPQSTTETGSCEDLGAPVIRQPFVGEDEVLLISMVAGARIFVFDAGGIEIGDGSGMQIGLSRVLVGGDVLTVLQQVGNCTSATGYQIPVFCTKPDQGC